MQHPFFWNGVFVFWCCRDDLSFFRKGVAKICRATASLFLHAVWASFVYPSINTRRAYDCGGSFFGCTGAGWQWTGLGLIFSFKICPEETPRQWWFSPKKIHMESPNEGSRQPFVLFFFGWENLEMVSEASTDSCCQKTVKRFVFGVSSIFCTCHFGNVQ